MKRRIGQIDLDTGEVLNAEGGGVFVYVEQKRRNGFGKGWLAMAQDPLDILATADVTGETYRVLFKLLARLDFENLIAVNQSDIAKELGLKRENVNRSIRALVNLGVLLKGPRIGAIRSFRLNPHFGWKGNSKNHRQALHENDELQQRMQASGIRGVIEGGTIVPPEAVPTRKERKSAPRQLRQVDIEEEILRLKTVELQEELRKTQEKLAALTAAPAA